jgi:hypothetical protein
MPGFGVSADLFLIGAMVSLVNSGTISFSGYSWLRALTSVAAYFNVVF